MYTRSSTGDQKHVRTLQLKRIFCDDRVACTYGTVFPKLSVTIHQILLPPVVFHCLLCSRARVSFIPRRLPVTIGGCCCASERRPLLSPLGPRLGVPPPTQSPARQRQQPRPRRSLETPCWYRWWSFWTQKLLDCCRFCSAAWGEHFLWTRSAVPNTQAIPLRTDFLRFPRFAPMFCLLGQLPSSTRSLGACSYFC